MNDARKIDRRLVRGANHGIVSTGDFATNIQADVVNLYEALAPIAEVEAPPGFSSLPAYRGLVGRRGELDQLEEILGTGEHAAVICGLGGRGKSALAAEWARSYGAGLVRWIPADSAARVTAGLGAIASALETNSVLLGEVALSERAIQWLDSHPGWVIVLDNVTDRRDVEELVSRLRGRGRFLITTLRPTGWTDLFEVLPLDDLPEADCVELFLQRAGLSLAPESPDRVTVSELCAELGYLALAIEQAAAYVSESGISVADYRRLLAIHPAETYSARAEGVDSARTISRLWSLTLDRLEETPLAAGLLRMMSWLDGGEIPREIVCAAETDTFTLTEAIRRLGAFSLVQHGPRGAVSVHGMVQSVYRTPDDGDRHRTGDLTRDARLLATAALLAFMPEEDLTTPDTWPRWRIIVPHIEALARYTIGNGIGSEAVAVLLNAAGAFAISQGQTARAIETLTSALALFREGGGERHPLTLVCQNNLASAQEDAGDLFTAIALHEETLTARVSTLGEDHPDTLTSRANLASTYEAAGDFERAIPLLEGVLEARERVLGVDHRHTLISRNNLAFTYGAEGRPEKALPMFEEMLAERLSTLGAQHVDTIVTRHNLAQVLGGIGALDEASTQIEQALADAIKIDGPDGLLVASIQEATGEIRLAQRRWVEAVKARNLALATRERKLGPDHPETMTTRNNLAHTFELAGNIARATLLYERTLADRERVLGLDHPHTLVSRNNLGNIYEAAGDLARAIPILDFAVEEFVRVLGPLHPSSLNGRVSQAYAYRRNGELPLAHRLYAGLLRDHIRVYGAAHPQTKIMNDTLEGIRNERARRRSMSAVRLQSPD